MVSMEILELWISEISSHHATQKPHLHGQKKATFPEADVLAHTCYLSTLGVERGRKIINLKLAQFRKRDPLKKLMWHFLDKDSKGRLSMPTPSSTYTITHIVTE